MVAASRLFGTNGVRGVFGESMTPHLVHKLGVAIGVYYGTGSTGIVGSDYRQTSDCLKASLVSGLTSAGADVLDIGYLPTPGVQYVTKISDVEFGVVITASHNPPEFNGIKLIHNDGVEVPRPIEVNVENHVAGQAHGTVSWGRVGRVHYSGSGVSSYVRGMLKHIDVDRVKSAGLTAVVDTGNSVGALVTPILLSKLGVRVISVNGNLDGRFPGRPSEPTPSNLGLMSEVARDNGADFGVAHDGDADRAIFCTSSGEFQYGDRTVALIARWWFERDSQRRIVTPVSSSTLIEDIASEYDAEIIWTEVGSIRVSRKMLETGTKLGGEENGGVFFGPHQPVRDGAMAAALMVQILSETNQGIEELLNSLPNYYQFKDKVSCPSPLKERIVALVKDHYSDHEIDETDGLKVRKPDGWILIRKSGTEPIIRCFSEAKNETHANQYGETAINLIKELVDSAPDM